MNRLFLAAAVLGIAGCGGGGGGSTPPQGPVATPTPVVTPTPAPPFQPLALGDSWTYQCHNTQNAGEQPFTIVNAVTGTATVSGTATFAFSIQVPTSPSQIATVVQLLANDAAGNTAIYGYLVAGTPQAVTRTVIVAAAPAVATPYDYPGPSGTTIPRAFVGFENSNPTALGTFLASRPTSRAARRTITATRRAPGSSRKTTARTSSTTASSPQSACTEGVEYAVDALGGLAILCPHRLERGADSRARRR